MEKESYLNAVRQFLTPTDPTKSITNPVHGQTATDRYGTVYTYNATLGGWLLSPVEVTPDMKVASVGMVIPWYIMAGEVAAEISLTTLGWLLLPLTLSGDTYTRYIPAPRTLPRFPGAVRDGHNAGRARWKAPDGRILE